MSQENHDVFIALLFDRMRGNDLLVRKYKQLVALTRAEMKKLDRENEKVHRIITGLQNNTLEMSEAAARIREIMEESKKPITMKGGDIYGA